MKINWDQKLCLVDFKDMRLTLFMPVFLFITVLSQKILALVPIWKQPVQRAMWIINSQDENTDRSSISTSSFFEKNRPLVVVFLSVKCPCSNSHVSEIKSLYSQFKNQFQFLIVHANQDESSEQARLYFVKKGLEIPVLRDEKLQWANGLKALKTPHAFVIDKSDKILYQGGVSNSADIENANVFFLRQALDQISKGQTVQVSYGRTLGCIIERGDDKNVWK